MLEIVLNPVQSLYEALCVRTIRNQCYPMLTGDPRKLGFWEQVRWYYRQYRQGEMQLFLVRANGAIIGYTALRRRVYERKDYQCSTICVLPQFQGRGYGRRALEILVELSHQQGYPVLAEVRADNARSNPIHDHWMFLKTEDGVNYYVC